jgi:hypothetical protein
MVAQLIADVFAFVISAIPGSPPGQAPESRVFKDIQISGPHFTTGRRLFTRAS